jgi:hypothetical protein
VLDADGRTPLPAWATLGALEALPTWRQWAAETAARLHAQRPEAASRPLIAVVGLPGSGASAAVQALRSLGLAVLDLAAGASQAAALRLARTTEGKTGGSAMPEAEAFRVLDGYDAVAGAPTPELLPELLALFPQLRVVLTLRDPVDWWETLHDAWLSGASREGCHRRTAFTWTRNAPKEPDARETLEGDLAFGTTCPSMTQALKRYDQHTLSVLSAVRDRRRLLLLDPFWRGGEGAGKSTEKGFTEKGFTEKGFPPEHDDGPDGSSETKLWTRLCGFVERAWDAAARDAEARGDGAEAAQIRARADGARRCLPAAADDARFPLGDFSASLVDEALAAQSALKEAEARGERDPARVLPGLSFREKMKRMVAGSADMDRASAGPNGTGQGAPAPPGFRAEMAARLNTATRRQRAEARALGVGRWPAKPLFGWSAWVAWTRAKWFRASPKPLVLGVGLGKTGTTSLARALERLGIRAAHYTVGGHGTLSLATRGGGEDDRFDFQRFDPPGGKGETGAGIGAVLDNPIPEFWPELLSVYPNARVVLTVRDEEAWLSSAWRLFKGIGCYQEDATAMKYDASVVHNFPYGLPCPSRLQLLKRFVRHNHLVRTMVREDRLLVMDLEAEDDASKWARLAAFVGTRPPPEGEPFPHANRREFG